ncbi:MAG: Peptidase rhomboid domain protein [Gemmatimonadetes bacterium]|nr:Peptidase rhomboid domain protein [Gemmatimonadota bacterium]
MTPSNRRAITPWVRRLAIANAAVLVVLRTVVTRPAVTDALRFDPARLSATPWTAVTYPFVHDSALHLLFVLLLFLTVGPAVERRMGGRRFLLFYFYCAVGAALAAVALSQLMTVPAMGGALAPSMGLVFAWAWYTGDDEIHLDPLPVRARLGALAALFSLALLVAAAVLPGHGLSLAHLAGAVAGWLFFRLQLLVRPPAPTLPMPIRRPALAPMRAEVRQAPTEALSVSPSPQPSMGVEDAAEAVNRVLDKISSQGIGSLTPHERRLLTNYAEQKRKERES